MKEIEKGSGHYLTRRQQELLLEYARSPIKRREDYEFMIDHLKFLNAYAFHNANTLSGRHFYHCPVSPIPYKTCYRKVVILDDTKKEDATS